MFAGPGIYLQIWARVSKSGLIFAGVGLYLLVWAYLGLYGQTSLGLYLQLWVKFAGLDLYLQGYCRSGLDWF